jgi:hypothetical protein
MIGKDINLNTIIDKDIGQICTVIKLCSIYEYQILVF